MHQKEALARRERYMEHNRIFQEIDPPKDMGARITLRIAHLERKTARIRLTLLGGTALGALGAIAPAYTYLSAEATRSGFTQYLSLIQTDSDIFLLHSKEFLLSLSETLPLTAMTLLLSIIFLLLWSLPRISTYARIAFENPKQFALS